MLVPEISTDFNNQESSMRTGGDNAPGRDAAMTPENAGTSGKAYNTGAGSSQRDVNQAPREDNNGDNNDNTKDPSQRRSIISSIR